MGQEVYPEEGEGGEEDSTGQPLRIDILTLFPGMFRGPFDESMIARAREAALVELRIHDLRAWAGDRHRTTDDYAYGGGGGMVLKPEPLFLAVESVLGLPPIYPGDPPPPTPVILMSPQGRRLDHDLASSLARAPRLVLLCGHYEGFDERVRRYLATDEISIGDFVLTGGELPAMVLSDAVARLRPGVVGHQSATERDSFSDGLLEHPHYTRPATWRGWQVPDVLSSGHHGRVAAWRRRQILRRTRERRPELLRGARLSPEEKAWLQSESQGATDPGDHPDKA